MERDEREERDERDGERQLVGSLLAGLARPPVSQPRMRHWEVEDDSQEED
jgi:hypothetical protein